MRAPEGEGGHPNSLRLSVTSQQAARALLRELRPAGDVHFYTSPTHGVYRIVRKPPAAPYSLERAKDWVGRKLSLNAVRLEAEHAGENLSPDLEDWEVRAGSAAVEAYKQLLPEAQRFRELLEVLHCDKMNRRGTMVTKLEQFLLMQGATVASGRHQEDPEADPEAVAQAKAAFEDVQARTKKQGADGPRGVAWPTPEEGLQLLKQSKAKGPPLSADDEKRLSIEYYLQTYGRDNLKSFDPSPHLWRRETQEQHRRQCELMPADDDPRPLAERAAHLAQKPVSQTELLEKPRTPELQTLEALNLLRMCGLEISSLDNFDDVHRDFFPEVPPDARKLLEKALALEKNSLQREKTLHHTVLGHLRAFLRQTLCIDLYNDVKGRRGFLKAGGAAKNRPRLRRIRGLPPLSRQQHQEYREWKRAGEQYRPQPQPHLPRPPAQEPSGGRQQQQQHPQLQQPPAREPPRGGQEKRKQPSGSAPEAEAAAKRPRSSVTLGEEAL